MRSSQEEGGFRAKKEQKLLDDRSTQWIIWCYLLVGNVPRLKMLCLPDDVQAQNVLHGYEIHELRFVLLDI